MTRYTISMLVALCLLPFVSVRAQTYDFGKPDTVLVLSKELKEISGLTALDARRLGAVIDEKGSLYVVHLPDGKVEEKPFGKKGDYESVERLADEVWILRSDGRLFRLNGWQGKVSTRSYKTGLSSRQDTEGMAYDPALRRLLIAAKENPGKGIRNARAVYSFDPRTQRRDDTISFRMRAEDLRGLDFKDFKPSGMAIHPVTRDRYVISSVSRTLVVVDTESTIIQIHPLPAVLEQPEGIAFMPDGRLYIASEGVKHPAVIILFRPVL